MIDRRRILISAGGIVAIAGCTGGEQQPEEGETNNSTQSAGSDSESNTSEPDEPAANIEITSVSAPETVEQGELVDVTVTVTGDVIPTVTAEAVDVNGETIAEDSIETEDVGEQTVTLSLGLGAQVPTGNSTIRVRATNGTTTTESSADIEIVRIPPDWQDPFEEAKTNIEQFFSKYAAVGSESDDATILDTSISDGYSNEGSGNLQTAEDLAWEAFSEAEGGARQRMDRLRDEVAFLMELRDLQSQTCTIFSLFETELERFRGDQPLSGEVDSQYQTVSDTHQQVSNTLEGLDPVVGADYEAKLDQIEGELEIVDLMINAMSAVFSSRNFFNEEFYGTAFDRAQSARRDFGLAARDIGDEGTYPPNDAIDTPFRDHAEMWQAEASEIENKSSGRQTEDDSQ